MKTIAMCLILSVALLLTTTEEANAEGVAKRTCYNTDLISILETQPVSGKSKLCVSKRGITASLIGKDLIPGNIYTVWWVYFDDPSQCVGGAAPGQCGPADFGGEKPLAALGRMDSGLAPNNGRRWFTDRLRSFTPPIGFAGLARPADTRPDANGQQGCPRATNADARRLGARRHAASNQHGRWAARLPQRVGDLSRLSRSNHWIKLLDQTSGFHRAARAATSRAAVLRSARSLG